MSSKYCFPSIGELVKFIYEISSILSDKNNSEAIKQKKTFQKSIQRLSKEEGELEESYFSSMEQYLKVFHKYVGCRRSANALAEVFQDIFAVYKAVIKSDAIFLSKKENVKRFIDSYLITRIVLSTHKQYLCFNITEEKYTHPKNEFWFLPQVSQKEGKNEVRWPLSIALEWIYEVTHISQTRFHYPDKSDRNENLILKRNLENANNWSNNLSNPTWNDLYNNIKKSFEALNRNDNPINSSKRKNILLILFIAHVSTNIGKKLLKVYGISYLKDVIKRYRAYSGFIRNNDKEIKKIIENKKVQSFRSGTLLNTSEQELLWLDLVPQYWRYQADKSQEFAVIYQQYLINNKKSTEKTINKWCQRYGEFLVKTALQDLEHMEFTKPPLSLFKLTDKGFSLINKYEPKKHDQFVKDLKTSNFNEVLKWLLLWINAERCLSKKMPEEAFKLFKDAFEEAKYTAGSKQYQLVNKYISICARQNNYVQFKKAMAWAYFIGLKIRIIRGIEDFNYQDSKHMKFAFDLLKKTSVIN